MGAGFVLNISVETDFSHAAMTDELAGTVSYADVVSVVQHEMAVPSSLLEHVAHRIATALLDSFASAMAVEIELMKENPPMGSDCDGAGVTLRVERKEKSEK